MITRKILDKVLATLPEERLRQLLDFAQFLSLQEEGKEWCRAGLASLEKSNGEDELDYSDADVKAELNK